MTYICDNARHLICEPYSIANLHAMAEALGIKKCWFHRNHYDIPKLRIEEIRAKCKVVSSKEIVHIIKGIKLEKEFSEPGTFKSLWAAERWLMENGYSYGSTSHFPDPVAIRKREYDLPQKWHNMTKAGKAMVDGIMTSNDWREGTVKVIIYNK